MYILLIKTSSLGDIIHTLPALTEAYRYYPDLHCDWVVEEEFAEIPSWHPAVKKVIPVNLRQWRKHPWQGLHSQQWQAFKQQTTEYSYDLVLDAQGLLKSAFLALNTRGIRHGLDYYSAREPLASFVYQRKYYIPREQHAVERLRQLFSRALNYPLENYQIDYGISQHFEKQAYSTQEKISLLLLHGTTWVTKHWPEAYWTVLAERATVAGCTVYLPWGNAEELKRAEKIAGENPNIFILSKRTLNYFAKKLVNVHAVVGVDTGLSHLAAALNIPTITLYGATSPARTGTYGQNQLHLKAEFPCSPCLKKTCTYRGEAEIFPACYTQLSVDKVWASLQKLLPQLK